MLSPYAGTPRQADGSGDDVVFRCAACALGCGAAASAVAAFGCTNQVLALFTPELSWLVLAPALLIVLVGCVGLCASRRIASKLFRAQLAVFLLVLAAMLAGVGVFAFVFTGVTADWIIAGCDDHNTEGLWQDAGRIAGKMKDVHHQYLLLHGGLTTCRSLNPLVYDLAACGLRARCPDGREAKDQPLYGFFQHVQLAYACGGFCTDDVPIFGLATMRETLEQKGACAAKVAESVESLGRIFGVTSVAMSLPVAVLAMVLFCTAGYDGDDDDFEELEGSDLDEDGRLLQVDPYAAHA